MYTSGKKDKIKCLKGDYWNCPNLLLIRLNMQSQIKSGCVHVPKRKNHKVFQF